MRLPSSRRLTRSRRRVWSAMRGRLCAVGFTSWGSPCTGGRRSRRCMRTAWRRGTSLACRFLRCNGAGATVASGLERRPLPGPHRRPASAGRRRDRGGLPRRRCRRAGAGRRRHLRRPPPGPRNRQSKPRNPLAIQERAGLRCRCGRVTAGMPQQYSSDTGR